MLFIWTQKWKAIESCPSTVFTLGRLFPHRGFGIIVILQSIDGIIKSSSFSPKRSTRLFNGAIISCLCKSCSASTDSSTLQAFVRACQHGVLPMELLHHHSCGPNVQRQPPTRQLNASSLKSTRFIQTISLGAAV